MTQFEKVAEGKYAVAITLANGSARRILVKKVDALNPSARGGAYATEWRAYNGGLNLKVHAETRQAAFDLAIATLQARGVLSA